MPEVINNVIDVENLARKYKDGHLPDLLITLNKCGYLFYGYHNLVSIKSITFTKKMTECYNMFGNCVNLESIPWFDTSNVTDMGSMFCQCHKLKSIPLFDTRKVKNMGIMFLNCKTLKIIPEFIVDPFIPMVGIIEGCDNLKKLPEFILINQLAK